MKNHKRTHNVRLIKQDYTYYIPEICERLGVHKNTVRDWQRHGLARIDDRRPHAIHGSALKEFLANKQSSRKHTCKPEEIYCLKCRKPCRPKDGNVDIIVRNEKLLNLRGKCEQCGCSIHRGASVNKLPELAGIYNILKTYNAHLLEETDNPAGNNS